MAYAATLNDVRAARERIAAYAHITPIFRCETLNKMSGRSLFFKAENLQKVGAFKFRGAMNAVLQLSEAEASAGVVTHSSGNHAQALALAARTRGIPATIIMPDNAVPAKKAAVLDYGAEVVECIPTLEARETAAQSVLDERGGTFIHPYNHPHIIAGQGTSALEFMEQVPDLDAIIAPVGGGGLMSGICVAVRGTQPWTKLIAAEPSGADDFARSMAQGTYIPQTAPDTLADGLLTSTGDLTWPILRDHVNAVFTAEDTEIIAAMRLLWERAKLFVEPSAAVGLAIVLAAEFKALEGLERVGIVLSGGNPDLDALPWVTGGPA